MKGSDMLRIAIFGAGAMGTVLGAYLVQAGKQIDLISRNVSHILGMKEHGAHITGTVQMNQQVSAMLPSEMTGKYDIIFLMTKQLDNHQIVSDLVPFLEDDGVICTMQNGLPELSVSEVIGESRTIGCAMSWGATLIGGGVCELTSTPDRATLSFSLGTYGSSDTPHFREIKALLELMGDVHVETNFIGARWAKLLVNSAFSGLSTITGANFGEIASHPGSRRIGQAIIKECIDVAHKAGIQIEPIQGKNIEKLFDYHSRLKKWIGYLIIPIAMKKHRLIKSSMLGDLAKGKNCEIEAINGVICKYGDKVGIDTPMNDQIVKIVHEIESGTHQVSWDNLSLLKIGK